MDPNLYCLCIGVDAYFYGWCDANPDFGIWSEMAQLKSLCLVVSESVYSKAAYWPTGQILDLGKLHFSHINFFLTRRNWETDPFLCFKFSTWELRRFIDLKRSVNCNPMGNIQFCNYNLFLYAKAWRRVFQATKTTYKPAGNKGADFQVWEVANHWNATTKRFMKKLGSLPSRTDEIGFAGEPKIKLPNQNLAQNSRLWCQHKLWIETLQRFFCCPRIQQALPHRPASMSKMARFSG